MKKILFVIDSLHSGGAEKSLLSLLTLFDYENYSVDLLMFSPTGLYLPLLPKEVNVLEVPRFIQRQFTGMRNLLKNKNFKDLYLRLRRSISLRNPFKTRSMHGAQISWSWMSKGMEQLDGKYDVAIAYSQGTPTYFVAEKVDATKKICWVNTDYKIAPYNRTFDIEYYDQYDNIIAVSDYNKEVFISEMPIAKEKTSVVYDIVSPSLIKSMALQDGGFDDGFDGTRILTIGRLVEAKGYDMAMEVCYLLKKQGVRFKWYVIGEGNLKSKLESLIRKYQLENTFILLGTYQNPYVFLKQCNYYVQPSRFEGFGLALAEAKILQKPIVTTDFTVVHNQIQDRVNGIIVKMDAESILAGLKGLLGDRDLQDNICENLKNEKIGTEQEIHKIYSIIEKA